MKFNHLLYDSNINFNSISKKKLVLSILLGLVSAIVIYSFFYVMREADRMMTLDLEYRPITIDEASRKLFNLFFAAISLLLGNSIAISFLVSRPQNLFSRRNYKRGRIINDQAFLVPSFIYWFTKIWFLFCAFAFEFFGTKFLDEIFIPSILLVIVLYLDSWKTLILVIKKNRWKIQFIHLISFVALTFVLSRIDIVDYKSIDDSILIANPSVDVPSSLYHNENHQKYYYDHLIFKMDFISEKEVGLFTASNEQIELYELHGYIEKWSRYIPEEDQMRISPKLRANKNIPLVYIKRFELALIELNHLNIIYEIVNNDELTSRYFNSQIKHRISSSLENEISSLPGTPPKIPLLDFYENHNFTDTLRLNISKKIKINGIETPLNMFSHKLKNNINESSIIEYIYDDVVTYQDYINVLSAHKMAVWELRVTENYDEIDALIRRNQFSRDEELIKKRSRLREKYPIHITERFE